MKKPNVTIQQLLEAGVHLGHKTLRWNPKMKKYIFGKRDSIHIIDLTQTLELTKVALEKVHEVISNDGNTVVKIRIRDQNNELDFTLKNRRNVDRKMLNIIRNKEISAIIR